MSFLQQKDNVNHQVSQVPEVSLTCICIPLPLRLPLYTEHKYTRVCILTASWREAWEDGSFRTHMTVPEKHKMVVSASVPAFNLIRQS